MTIWINVEDLFGYAARHRRPSGIQRATLELVEALYALPGTQVGLVRHDLERGWIWVVDWAQAQAQWASMRAADELKSPIAWSIHTGPRAAPASTPHCAAVDSPPPRRASDLALALAEAAKAQGAALRLGAQAVKELAKMGLAIKGAAKKGREIKDSSAAAPEGPLLADLAQPGDVLCIFGMPQSDTRLFDMIEQVTAARGVALVALVHDIIPLRRPEFFMPDAGFERLIRWMAPQADQVLTVSRATATSLSAWADARGLTLRRPPRPIPLGSGFAERAAAPLPPQLAPGGYVLFVSTIEPRKNHVQALQVWRRLLDTRPAGSVPKLVFAGRVGWMSGDLMAALDSADWLDGAAMLVREPSDTALAALYAGAAFTLFLSHDEGWGLPVSESLAFGRTCVASRAASIPEAGGDLCFYVDPDNTTGVYDMVSALIDEPERVARMEARIRAYRSPGWIDTARAVRDAIEALAEAPALRAAERT